MGEEVVFRVASDGRSMEVDGRYHLRNLGWLPLAASMRFPFPAAEPLRPETVLVELDGESVPARLEGAEARFALGVGSRSAAVLRVRYRQPLLAPVGRYVVATVRSWGRPLAEASFRVELPPGCALEQATAPIDPKTGSSVARDFWPGSDLEFSWSCRAPPHTG